MKKLLFILLLIPAALDAQIPEAMRNMTKERAQNILKEAAHYKSDSWNIWPSDEKKQNTFILTSPDANFLINATIVRHPRTKSIFISFILFADESEIPQSKLMPPNGVLDSVKIGSKSWTNLVIQYDPFEKGYSGTYLLNFALIFPKGLKSHMQELHLGAELLKAKTFFINGKRFTQNNPELLYAAAYLMEPGLSYEKFLQSATMPIENK